MLITDHLKDQRHDSPERHAPRTSEPRVLIADDQSDVLEALRLLLKAEGFVLETASSPAGVLAAVEAREFDVALIDLNYARDTTSGEEGLNLLSRIQGIDPTLPVVVMTAWGSVEVAVGGVGGGGRGILAGSGVKRRPPGVTSPHSRFGPGALERATLYSRTLVAR